MEERKQGSRIIVVSAQQAHLISQREATIPGAAVALERSSKLNFMGAVALPYYDQKSDHVEHGLSCAGCQLAIEKEIIGARGEKWAFEARDKVYS